LQIFKTTDRKRKSVDRITTEVATLTANLTKIHAKLLNELCVDSYNNLPLHAFIVCPFYKERI
jgi:fructoselysine-6-P-deglycase FrlB-like protein